MQIRRRDEYFLLSFRWASYIGTNKWIVASESNTPGRERMAWWIHFLACLDSSVVVDLKPESQFLWLGGRPCHVTSSCEQSRQMDAAWCHIQRDLNIWERVPMQHIQWPVGVASAWEDSQRTSQVYMLLSATAHCGHWPASDIKPRLRGIRIFLMSSWQIYPPFLSYHPRPGSHIEKNWKHMI